MGVQKWKSPVLAFTKDVQNMRHTYKLAHVEKKVVRAP